MSGGKGGSTTSQVQIPGYIEDASKRNLERADALATLGYVPYYGPDVAAQTPLQLAALGNLGSAASAYGLGTVAPSAGMPQATEYAGGIRGYSSAPIFEQSVSQLQANRPGQYDALTGMFVDPITGAQPNAPFGYEQGRYLVDEQPTPVAAPVYTGVMDYPGGR